MSLPNVNINFSNGSLGTVIPPADGVCAMAIKFDSVATASGWQLFRSYAEVLAAADYPTDETDTGMLEVKAFFDKGGTKLYLKCLATTATHTAISTAEMDNLYNASNGEVRTLGVMLTVATVGEISYAYIAAMQAAADYMRNTYRAPLQVIVASSGTANAAIALTNDCPDVSLVVGQTNPNTAKFISSIGALLGRIASTDVQVNPGRVSDGGIADAAYDVHSNALLTNSQAENYNDRSFITYRTFAGKGGYYISDDPTMTAATSDYHSFARRRTANKAFRVANDVLVNRINSEVETSEGKILPVVAKGWEAEVESAIRANMTAYGNIVDVNGDGGVKCTIDPEWNVMATSTVKATLQIRPYGYAKFINVELGFML
ncbi:MAG: DUF2586 family protein [Prevotellaceae bacterium]|jgi:hypothetical protein|nr:DUF2586 family protein [Prevotellaceae bacterium]